LRGRRRPSGCATTTTARMELALIIAFLAFCLTLIVLSFTQNKTDKKVDKKNIILQRIIAQGGIAPDDLRNIKKVKGL